MVRGALLDKLALPGVQWAEQDGREVAASFGSVEEEYWALKESAGLMDLSRRGKLVVRGRDAPRFLHGMVTNEIKEMPVGQGKYAFFLDVHGHIQADAHILRLDSESYWLDTESQSVETVRQILGKYIIADDVVVQDQTAALGCLALEGPCALEVLREAIGFEPPRLLPLEHMEVPQMQLRLAHGSISGESGFWLWGSVDRLVEVWRKAAQAGAILGARPVGFLAAKACRIEAGVPRYGADINDKTLPQETGQMHAISYTKGCYLGQEIVERIRTRGHVNRKLVGLLFEGKQDVRSGAELLAADQSVGSITSAAYSYGLRRSIALGMVRRESAEPGTLLAAAPEPAAPSSAKGTALAAEVTSLPFFYPIARSATI
jgi:folate-binding protein YgfZ